MFRLQGALFVRKLDVSLTERLTSMMILADSYAYNLTAELEVLTERRIIGAIVHILDEDTSLIGVVGVGVSVLAGVFL